ncbi:hypothetical protein Dimus_015762 [Dionaea muscipula]
MVAMCCNAPHLHYLTLHSSPPLPSLHPPASPPSFRIPNRLLLRRSLTLENTEGSASEESSSCTRRLILLRPAESSWEDRSLRDHDRPLSKAGRDAAISVSHKLQKLGWVPELILCSDAMRTRQTLMILQEHVRCFLEAKVHFVSSFYSIAAMDGQTAEHLRQIICRFSKDEVLTIMCMGHNRGWEEAASMLSGTSIELKTCNAALLEAAGRSWHEAFCLAGFGGWKLHGIVKPHSAAAFPE